MFDSFDRTHRTSQCYIRKRESYNLLNVIGVSDERSRFKISRARNLYESTRLSVCNYFSVSSFLVEVCNRRCASDYGCTCNKRILYCIV